MASFKKTLFSALLLAVFTLYACATGTPQKSTAATKSYTEDLSLYRIRYEKRTQDKPSTSVKSTDPENPVAITSDITEKLHERLDAITKKNKTIKQAQGYRILIYAGNSSEEAKKAKEVVYDLIPDENVYTAYKQPSFKVKVGDCFDRLEANYLLLELKKDFPNAIVVPDQVNIN